MEWHFTLMIIFTQNNFGESLIQTSKSHICDENINIEMLLKNWKDGYSIKILSFTFLILTTHLEIFVHSSFLRLILVIFLNYMSTFKIYNNYFLLHSVNYSVSNTKYFDHFFKYLQVLLSYFPNFNFSTRDSKIILSIILS